MHLLRFLPDILGTRENDHSLLLETGHYLSSWGGGAEDLGGGDQLIFGSTKGGISRN